MMFTDAATVQNDRTTVGMDGHLFRSGIAHLRNLLRVAIYYAVV